MFYGVLIGLGTQLITCCAEINRMKAARLLAFLHLEPKQLIDSSEVSFFRYTLSADEGSVRIQMHDALNKVFFLRNPYCYRSGVCFSRQVITVFLKVTAKSLGSGQR